MSKEAEQSELTDLLPGSAGGSALRRLKGREYFVELGRRGGKATRDRYGVEHLRRLSERGGEANRRRYRTIPKTIHPWYGGEERRVPFWPPRATKRRKRPVYVRIEIRAPTEEEIDEIVKRQIERI
jgi:hypothetical protein